MVAINFVIEGKVQMVGFRYFLKHRAKQLGIKGWARNTRDGKVEGVIQGDTEKVGRMQEFIKKGPKTAQVRKHSFKEVPEEDFDDFVIKY